MKRGAAETPFPFLRGKKAVSGGVPSGLSFLLEKKKKRRKKMQVETGGGKRPDGGTSDQERLEYARALSLIHILEFLWKREAALAALDP